MPVKIVSGPTDAEKGMVNQADLLDGLSDYRDNITIETAPGRSGGPVTQTFSAFFYQDELKKLLAKTSGRGGIRIHFSVTFPDHQSCTGADYSNHLSVTLFATDEAGKDQQAVGDYVLLPGFKPEVKDGLFEDCCGTLNPPG